MLSVRPLRWLVVAALAGACASSPPFRPPQLDPLPREFRFEHDIRLFQVTNGMMVAVVPDRRTNLVRVDLRYRVGSREDPRGKSGLAHLVEHLVFEMRPPSPPSSDGAASEPAAPATPMVAAAEPAREPDDTEDRGPAGRAAPTIGERLGSLALFHNAYTIADETHYFATAFAQQLPALLGVYADQVRWGCDAVPSERFARERAVVQREIDQRGESEVVSQLRRLLYGDGHAYERGVGGEHAELAAITIDDVCGFLEDHYAPDRVILVVSGAVDPDAVQQAVGTAFGPIARKARGARTPVAVPALAGERARLVADTEEPAVLLAFPAPMWGSDEAMSERMIADRLESLLGQLVDGEDGITSAGSLIFGGIEAPIRIFILSLSDRARADAAVEAFFRERDKIFAGLDRADFRAMVGARRTRLVRNAEPFAWRAQSIADYLQYTRHHRFMIEDLQRLHRLEPQELLSDSRRFYTRDRGRVIVVEPAGEDAEITHKRVELATGARDFDIEAWQTPVDLAEADRALALPDSPEIEPRRARLANGMEVVLVPELEYPLVDVRVVFPVGDGDDPDDRPGLAAAAALTLRFDYERAYEWRDIRLMTEVLAMGGIVDAYTSDSVTVFRNVGLSAYADGILWELHWLLESGIYSKDVLESLRARARELLEKEAGSDDADRETAPQLLRRALFGRRHPYASGVSPLAALARMDRAQLQAFRARHYRADGATLIVTGRFDPAALMPRIERLFGAWSGAPRALEPRSVPPATPRRVPVAIAYEESERVQPALILAFDTPAAGIEEAARYLILEEMLEQRMRAVRERLGASYGVHAGYHAARGPGVLMVTGEIAPARVTDALRVMRNALAPLRAGPELADTDAEQQLRADFVRARRRVLERNLASVSDSDSVADRLVSIAARGARGDHQRALARQIAQLRFADMAPFWAEALAPAHEVAMCRGPRAACEHALREAGLENIQVEREPAR